MQRRPRSTTAVLVGALLLVATGCNKYGYEAHIDNLDVGPSTVSASGWFRDPFVAKRPMECASVWQILDGGTPTRVDDCGNRQRRPDLDAAHGDASNGFSLFTMLLSKGRHELCVQIAPVGATVPSGALDCRTFELKYDQTGARHFDGATVSNGVLTAEAWIKRTYLSSQDGLWNATWNLDGRWIRQGEPGATITVVDRPDVVAAVGDGQGYRITIPVEPGSHRICLALDNGFGAGGTSDDMCRAVVAP